MDIPKEGKQEGDIKDRLRNQKNGPTRNPEGRTELICVLRNIVDPQNQIQTKIGDYKIICIIKCT